MIGIQKSSMVTAFALCLSLTAGSAFAADLSNASGQSCTGDGTWHFVNNQTGGAAAGLLTAMFDSGSQGPLGPSAVNNRVQHFYVYTYGAATLLDAYTDLPGRLVLSDFSCATKPPCEKDCEPPPCDPKTDPKCVI